MIKIRRKVFETNSSSTHAISVPKELTMVKKGNIHLYIGEYGWLYGTHDLGDYIWTALCELYTNDEERNMYKDKIINVFNKHNQHITFQEPTYETGSYGKYLYTYCGYIDHYGELRDFINDIFNDDELLYRAITCGKVVTGNDNDYSYDDVVCYHNGDEDYQYFKLN